MILYIFSVRFIPFCVSPIYYNNPIMGHITWQKNNFHIFEIAMKFSFAWHSLTPFESFCNLTPLVSYYKFDPIKILQKNIRPMVLKSTTKYLYISRYRHFSFNRFFKSRPTHRRVLLRTLPGYIQKYFSNSNVYFAGNWYY